MKILKRGHAVLLDQLRDLGDVRARPSARGGSRSRRGTCLPRPSAPRERNRGTARPCSGSTGRCGSSSGSRSRRPAPRRGFRSPHPRRAASRCRCACARRPRRGRPAGPCRRRRSSPRRGCGRPWRTSRPLMAMSRVLDRVGARPHDAHVLDQEVVRHFIRLLEVGEQAAVAHHLEQVRRDRLEGIGLAAWPGSPAMLVEVDPQPFAVADLLRLRADQHAAGRG